jgi:RNA polymerase sigma-70 factor (ECF subfamily)
MNFEALAREHKDAVYRQLIRVCGNHEDAEDALIEALLKAYKNLDQLQESSAFRAWLAQIGRRVCWHLKEREALLPVVQLSALEEQGFDLEGDAPNAEVQVERKQMHDILERAVLSLPAGERDVYRLRDMEELSGEQVAGKLGISLAAMKSRLHRARAGVRKAVDSALANPAASAVHK